MAKDTAASKYKSGLAGHKDSQRKRLTNSSEKARLTFSFRYFQQSEPYFGLSGQQNKWFVSLLDRLKDVSKKDTDFLLDPVDAFGYRLHDINWDQKGMKVKREDFNWVDKVYLNNATDYEFMQFELSTGTGRIIGFIDETGSCFNIVALDPHHNLQPSKKRDWKVEKTHILESEIECLHSCIARHASLGQLLEEEIEDTLHFDNYEYCAIDKDFFATFSKLIEEGKIREKFQEFLLSEACK